MKFAVALVLSLLGAPPALAQDTTSAPQVYLVTMGVGNDIAERFGHNAVWIRDTVRGIDQVYNFGTFSTHDQVKFVIEFVRGRPNYWLDVRTMDQSLSEYQYRQRSVALQELNLSAAQRTDIAQRLAANARPENREYPYDYYLDNCATRVRDLLDQVLNGELKRRTADVPASGNLRFHTQRSITNNPFLYLGIMILMGPSTDGPLDQWGEMFLPGKIQERVRELTVQGPGGLAVPLVKEERVILPMDVYHAEDAPPAWGFRFLAIGVVLSLVILTGSSAGKSGRIGRIVARTWLVVAGAGGVLLAFVWFATNHVAAAGNRNLLLLSPLALLLLPQIRAYSTGPDGKVRRFIWFAFAGSLCVGTFLALVPAIGAQWNLQLAALVVPPSVACLVVSRQRAGAPASLQ